jgi:hypothetical protein
MRSECIEASQGRPPVIREFVKFPERWGKRFFEDFAKRHGLTPVQWRPYDKALLARDTAGNPWWIVKAYRYRTEEEARRACYAEYSEYHGA